MKTLITLILSTLLVLTMSCTKEEIPLKVANPSLDYVYYDELPLTNLSPLSFYFQNRKAFTVSFDIETDYDIGNTYVCPFSIYGSSIGSDVKFTKTSIYVRRYVYGGQNDLVEYFNDSIWIGRHQITFMYDSLYQYLYIDKELKGKQPSTLGINSKGVNVYAEGKTSWPYSGIITNLYVFDRVITNSELLQLK